MFRENIIPIFSIILTPPTNEIENPFKPMKIRTAQQKKLINQKKIVENWKSISCKWHFHAWKFA